MVVTDVDAIASLLLQAPAGLSPARGFSNKEFEKQRNAARDECPDTTNKQFRRADASSHAFQLLRLRKRAAACQVDSLRILVNLTHIV